MRGDEIVCRTDFDARQLGVDALVITETPHGRELRSATAADNILAVVVAFTREVAQ